MIVTNDHTASPEGARLSELSYACTTVQYGRHAFIGSGDIVQLQR